MYSYKVANCSTIMFCQLVKAGFGVLGYADV